MGRAAPTGSDGRDSGSSVDHLAPPTRVTCALYDPLIGAPPTDTPRYLCLQGGTRRGDRRCARDRSLTAVAVQVYFPGELAYARTG